MRVAELSKETGVPVPTIKYYLREGLLQGGERTSPNQVQYDEEHVQRLKLIRALVEVGGLSVAGAREVIARMETPGIDTLTAVGKAQYAMTAPKEHLDDEAWRASLDEVTMLVERQGWRIGPNNPARQTLAEVLATLRRLGQESHFGLLDDYASAAGKLAAAELNAIATATGDQSSETIAETVVLWTVLGDALLAALRRLAQEDAAQEIFGGHPPARPKDTKSRTR